MFAQKYLQNSQHLKCIYFIMLFTVSLTEKIFVKVCKYVSMCSIFYQNLIFQIFSLAQRSQNVNFKPFLVVAEGVLIL